MVGEAPRQPPGPEDPLQQAISRDAPRRRRGPGLLKGPDMLSLREGKGAFRGGKGSVSRRELPPRRDRLHERRSPQSGALQLRAPMRLPSGNPNVETELWHLRGHIALVPGTRGRFPFAAIPARSALEQGPDREGPRS
jgi:hypothetical protein